MVLRKILLLTFLCFALLEGFAAFAETNLNAQQQRRANLVFESVTSPFCPGRLLKDCPSSSAAELKETIRLKVKEGESIEQILDYLFALYGEELRASPEMTGFGVFAWITPFVFLLLGAMVIILWLKTRQSEEVVVTAVDEETRKQVESELGK